MEIFDLSVVLFQVAHLQLVFIAQAGIIAVENALIRFDVDAINIDGLAVFRCSEPLGGMMSKDVSRIGKLFSFVVQRPPFDFAFLCIETRL